MELVDLKKQTISGLTKSGCNVIDIGLNPTPILYFGSHHLNADGAIQITGSHNPPEFNGFKLSMNKMLSPVLFISGPNCLFTFGNLLNEKTGCFIAYPLS